MSDFLDSNGLRYLWTKIKNVFVAKETGKGLSSNDFTSTYKTKLDGIASGANKYTLPTASASTLGGIKVGSGLSISNGVLSASGGNGIKLLYEGYLEATQYTAGVNGYYYIGNVEFNSRILFVNIQLRDDKGYPGDSYLGDPWYKNYTLFRGESCTFSYMKSASSYDSIDGLADCNRNGNYLTVRSQKESYSPDKPRIYYQAYG